ncbi:DUF302 domain-containing protein [Pleurocapsa sp. PCC 7319]|uniref:DUF302 domain-containing protein n=1 Tax=Pleurocapsa sp. PCC 7319 TaxID=118161 RepID=UPI00035DC294|nr:DUF302 domain-containing protein [Pleurocapsa sp. PCC 7319]
MNDSIKYYLFAILIICASYSHQEIELHNSIARKAVAETVISENGLKTKSSPYDVSETVYRLEQIINDKGLTLFTNVDHSVNAEKIGAELKPTQLLIFGNPKVGTPLMECSPTTAIDLPQKILVWQNEDEQTQITYNQPQYLKKRHGIHGCDEMLAKVSGVLKDITARAIDDTP